VRDGIVYGIGRKAVEAFDLESGSHLRTYSLRTPEGAELAGVHQPVILDDTLLISSGTHTFVFDAAGGNLLQVLTGGGPLTYTDGVLMVSGTDNTLRAWRVNQPSVITLPEPVIAATEDLPFT
jgi:hypothetical protein